MLIPVRCFTCGYPIARFWDEYKEKVNKGENPEEVLNSLKIKRYCCRRMFLSTFEYIDDFLMYTKAQEESDKKELESGLEEDFVKKTGRGRRRKGY